MLFLYFLPNKYYVTYFNKIYSSYFTFVITSVTFIKIVGESDASSEHSKDDSLPGGE